MLEHTGAFCASISSDEVAERHCAVAKRFPGASFVFGFESHGGRIVSALGVYHDGSTFSMRADTMETEFDELAYDAYISTLDAANPVSAPYVSAVYAF